MGIEKELICKSPNLKVVRLKLPAGSQIPEHATNAAVVVTVTKGRGTFTIQNKEYSLKVGTVLHFLPEELHAIYAITDLEIIAVHMHLQQDIRQPVQCGASIG